MSAFSYDISPIHKIQAIEYVKYRMDITRIYLGEDKADISVVVSSEDETFNKIFYYVISGDEYIKWTGDNYIREWVKTRIRNETF